MRIRFEDYEVELIEQDRDLFEIASWLGSCKRIAVDTESNSLYAYFEKVCLVQFSAGGRHVLLDPILLESLEPLRQVFADPAIEKIFHAGEYDILSMKRDFNFDFANIFDTMIAAKILGRKEIGLCTLLESEFGITLNKKYQKANWGKRPINEEMIRYGAGDTMYLHRLRDRLSAELSERNLMPLAQEDFRHLCETPCGSNRPMEAVWWRVAKFPQDLTHKDALRLQSLVTWRELIAERENTPTYRVIRNDVLTDLATQHPKSMEELRQFPGLSDRLVRKHGKSLLRQLLQKPENEELTRPSSSPLPDQAIMIRRQVLRDWRRDAGLSRDVPSDVILPKELMKRIIVRGAGSQAELNELMSDYPVRRELYGEEIFAVLSAETEHKPEEGGNE